MKKVLKYVIGLIIVFFLYYIILPPINPTSLKFWFFLGLIAVVNFLIHITDVEWVVTKKNITM